MSFLKEKEVNKQFRIESGDISSIYIKTLDWMKYYGFKKIDKKEYDYLNGLYHYSKARYGKHISIRFNKEGLDIIVYIKIYPLDYNYKVNITKYSEVIDNYLSYMDKQHKISLIDCANASLM